MSLARSPAYKSGHSSLAYNRIARFKHWLEMRARVTPPKVAVCGMPMSARLGLDCRGLAAFDGTTYVWSWIGTHDEYPRLIASI